MVKFTLKRPFRPGILACLVPIMTGALAACGDGSNFTQDATLANVTTSAYVYALSGSSPERPAAYSISSATFVRPVVGSTSGAVNFDLAFDLTADGKVLLLPVRRLVPFPPIPAVGAPSVGLLRSGTAYDLVQRAANTGYTADSAAVAAAGDTYLFRLSSSGCYYGEPLYGKLVIDSIVVAERRMVVRVLTNRNCGGYRSLTVGLPKD